MSGDFCVYQILGGENTQPGGNYYKNRYTNINYFSVAKENVFF